MQMDHMISLSVGTQGPENFGRVFQDLSELARNLNEAHSFVSVSASAVGEDPDDVDYCNREHLRHDDNTLLKVREALARVGLTDSVIEGCIADMQNNGILFRERDN